MKAADRTDYIVRCLIDAASMYEDDAKAFLAEHDADHRAEAVAERDTEIVAWLGKKAREFRAAGGKQRQSQADAVSAMASKIARGAVRPDNTRVLPATATTEPDLHDAILSAVESFQASATDYAAGASYSQQLAQHVLTAVAPLVPYREIWDSGLPPGGRCCSICGQPVESEPCPDHAGKVTAPSGETTQTAELTATLYVDRSESRCGHCRKPTLVDGVTHHTNISGWTPQPSAGCGARFTAIAAANRAITPEMLRKMRPDLPVQDRKDTAPDYCAAVAEALSLLESAPEAFQQAPSQNITAAAGVLRRAHDGETTPADFFQPGHAYTHRDGSDFKCVAVTTHPQTGERLAMGWRVDSWALHYPATAGINQWNHEYDGAEPPDDHGSIEDAHSATELYEMDRDAEFRHDAEDDARNTAEVEAEERGDA